MHSRQIRADGRFIAQPVGGREEESEALVSPTTLLFKATESATHGCSEVKDPRSALPQTHVRTILHDETGFSHSCAHEEADKRWQRAITQTPFALLCGLGITCRQDLPTDE